MTRVAMAFLLLCTLVAAIGAARARADGGLFQESLTLDSGRILVVSEPRLEPRSVGSFSVRLYSGRDARFPYDDFLSGVILPRDGVVERLCPLPAEPDGQTVLVMVRSVGTGGYLSGHSLLIQDGSIDATPFEWSGQAENPGASCAAAG